MFPARSNFASGAAYSAWWYVTEGGGRRRVCATNGGNFISDIKAIFRQFRWQYTSPDGVTTRIPMQGRPDVRSAPPIPLGTLRVPPVPQEVIDTIQREAREFLSQLLHDVALAEGQAASDYLVAISRIPGGTSLSTYRYFEQILSSPEGARLVSEFQAFDADLPQRIAMIERITGAPMVRPPASPPPMIARVAERVVISSSLGDTAITRAWLTSIQQDASVILSMPQGAARSQLTRALRSATEYIARMESQSALILGEQMVAEGGSRFVPIFSRMRPEQIIEIADSAEAAAIMVEAEGRAAQTMSTMQRWPGVSRFFRGMANGFAFDMPVPIRAYISSDVGTDAAWNDGLQASLAAYLRSYLGAPTIWANDDLRGSSSGLSNVDYMARWLRSLPVGWQRIYQQLVDDYNNRSVSITSVHVAAWILSNWRTLSSQWRVRITDPRQARGFTAFGDIGVPADANMPSWGLDLHSDCLPCPMLCLDDTSGLPAFPTRVLPVNFGQIHDIQIRLSIAEPPEEPAMMPGTSPPRSRLATTGRGDIVRVGLFDDGSVAPATPSTVTRPAGISPAVKLGAVAVAAAVVGAIAGSKLV